MLESIQGRVEDSLILPALSDGQVLIRPLVINRVMDVVPVSGWQLIQQADTRNGLADEKLVSQIRRSLAQEGAHVPYIRIQHVPEIPKTASGKAPLIKAYHPASESQVVQPTF